MQTVNGQSEDEVQKDETGLKHGNSLIIMPIADGWALTFSGLGLMDAKAMVSEREPVEFC